MEWEPGMWEEEDKIETYRRRRKAIYLSLILGSGDVTRLTKEISGEMRRTAHQY